MTNNWTMPDWLRDALLACGYCQESIGEADSLYDTDKQEIRLSAISGNDILDIANSIDDLIPLRDAGLLLTPGEKANLDDWFRCDSCAVRERDKELTLLRADIEQAQNIIGIFGVDNPMTLCESAAALKADVKDLTENYQRADKGLMECCRSREKMRAENDCLRKRIQRADEDRAGYVAEIGRLKAENGRLGIIISVGDCDACEAEAEKIHNVTLGAEHDKDGGK